ncbi:hypothetical protein ACSBR2_005973 [Camellia fascicularis]|uniref:DUF7054 domain-containing protein n=2 Tax=Camellia sinensis TaxID=4442 RepID=A0A7J7GZ16_CAMSI|nr:uncharacterized protein LOC114270521 [Camellia sinensis]KAF5945607.1 hypothetical protein HYC85_015835 [Camellia sinensis]THG15316.1 hypothetical protein TEA_008784 [Camellia sinensis var. sinensis]
MVLHKQKKNQAIKGGNRLLVSITVLGSAGPIRFIVHEGELVAAVMETALKSYAREGRLPVLGSNLNDFVLCSPIAGPEALSPWEAIGAIGVRNFMLCKKPQSEKAVIDEEKQRIVRKSNCSWKAWFNKSLNLNISSH